MLESMKDLVKFCEENILPSKKRVIIREPSLDEKDKGEVSGPHYSSIPKVPLKSSFNTKNKASFLVKPENKLAEVSKKEEKIDPTETLIDTKFT